MPGSVVFAGIQTLCGHNLVMGSEHRNDGRATAESSFAIRVAKPDDAPGIADVWLCAHEGVRDEAIARIRGELALAARGAGRVVWIATNEDRVVGYGRAREFSSEEMATYRNCPAGWWLSGSAVLPAYRRRGIARALVRARIDQLPGAIHSRADVSNGASRALHEQCGFREVTRDFVAPGMRNPDAPMILYRSGSLVGRGN